MDHSLIDQLPCGVVLIDAGLAAVHCSPRALQLVPQLGGQGTLPECITQAVGALAGEQLVHACQRMLDGDRVGGGTWGLTHGGARCWLAWDLAPLSSAPAVLALTLHDVSSQVALRRDAEAAVERNVEAVLAESESRFRALADALPVLVWMVGTDGTCEYVNHAWQDFTGRSDVEEQLSGWDHGLHPDDATHALAVFHQALQARRQLQVEYRLRRHDGTWRWMLDVGAPRFTPDGSFAGFIGACIDIHERREATDRARCAEERLRLALAAGDMGVFRIDPAIGVDLRDANLNRLLGLEPVESTQPVADFIARVHPEDRTASVDDFARGWRDGHYAGEIRIIRPDGDVRWLRGFGRVTAGGDTRPMMTGVVFDVTERRRAEQELAAKAAELSRSNADLEQFAYVASHDLQEPLRMIGSYLTLLRRRCESRLDATAFGYLDHVVDGAVRMRQLINDLLAFSRLGRPDALEEEVDLDIIVDEVLHLLASEVRRTGARIERQPLPRVFAHRAQLVQLLQNLVSNALKYRGSDPPRITLATEPGDEAWTFHVRDNGIGLDPLYAERVFELFQRLHTRQEYPGTGIGLTLCRKIVTLLGGRIWVESSPGQGATFSFTIPARRIKGMSMAQVAG